MTLALPVAFPLVSNLVSMPNGAAKGLGSVGAAAVGYVDDVVAPIFVKTGASVNPAGQIDLFLLVAEEIAVPSVYTDGINPDALTTQHALIGPATIANAVDAINPVVNPLTAATVYCFQGFSVRMFLGYTPTFWAVLVWNRSGGALDSTAANFYAKHSLST